MTSPHKCHPCSPSATRTLPRKSNTAGKPIRKQAVDSSHGGHFWCKLHKVAETKTANSFFIENYITMCSIHYVCYSVWINNAPLHLSAIYLCPASITDMKPWHAVPRSPFCWQAPCTTELNVAHYAKLAVFSRIFCPEFVLRISNLCLKDTFDCIPTK